MRVDWTLKKKKKNKKKKTNSIRILKIHLTNNYWCKTNLSLITTDFLCNNLNIGIKCIYLLIFTVL